MSDKPTDFNDQASARGRDAVADGVRGDLAAIDAERQTETNHQQAQPLQGDTRITAALTSHR
ncbi:hypothetical protein [Thiohalophilus sp.]|uniref:hypothetical protein n=1 Tax=Thiohalophilus sp. TaxID=3028392 RepID=UPI002ACE73A6|nr:hypothetical protein [Thiohalophilus sp.]MDZ7804314.1 hypothetical protein [Thiohalophilus sp.]